MPHVVMLVGLIGGFAGFLLLGPEFSGDHSLAEQIAFGLVAILMICTLFGMRIGTVFGILFRLIVIAVIWRILATMLRVVRLR